MADTKTDRQESSQALFCALADYAGTSYVSNNSGLFNENVIKDYNTFKTKWEADKKFNIKIKDVFEKQVKSGKSTFADIENFLINDPSWYKSSILISKKLILEIESISSNFSKIKKPKWKDIFYNHQDELMEDIQKLWSQANKKQKNIKDTKLKKTFIPFGDLNKWNPADIYFSSTKAQKIIKEYTKDKKFDDLNFQILNKLISDLIDDGELLPLSLKKQTSTITLKKVNFNKTKESKDLEQIKFGGYFWKKYETNNKTTKKPARDLKIYMKGTKSEKDVIVLRHDPSTNYFRGEIILKGMEARAGGLGTGQIISIIEIVDPAAANKLKNIIKNCINNFKINKEPIRKKFESLTKGVSDKKQIQKIRSLNNYDEKIGEISAKFVTNPIMPNIISILEDDKKGNEFVRLIYMYAASQTTLSSKFVVAK